MASLSEELRDELAAIDPRSECDRLAELSGLFHTAGSVHLRGRGAVSLHLDLSSSAVARRAFALLRSFRAPFNLKAWLTVITRRTCLRTLRRPADAPLERDVAAPEPAPEPTEETRALERLLPKLPAEDRLVLDLFFRREASYEQIGALLGISAESVGKRKFRALERLRDLARAEGLDPFKS